MNALDKLLCAVCMLNFCLQPLVVIENLRRVCKASHFVLKVRLNIRDVDGGFLLEYGTAQRSGEGEDDTNKEDLQGSVGSGIFLEESSGVKAVHDHGDHHHS